MILAPRPTVARAAKITYIVAVLASLEHDRACNSITHGCNFQILRSAQKHTTAFELRVLRMCCQLRALLRFSMRYGVSLTITQTR